MDVVQLVDIDQPEDTDQAEETDHFEGKIQYKMSESELYVKIDNLNV